jgi:hypothetical protein
MVIHDGESVESDLLGSNIVFVGYTLFLVPA